MANDIDGVFNCVSHEQLINLLEHNHLPKNLVQCISAFNTNRWIHLAFDRKSEVPVPFRARLPHGSPLSPILFVMYCRAQDYHGGVPTTVYCDDEIA